MTTIGIDTHKLTVAACAVDPLGVPLAEASFDNDPAGHRQFAAWARRVAPEARIGIEGSASYGAALARGLHAAGFDVVEVPPHLSRRERGRTRRPGKSDAGDALAIARVTARERSLPPVRLAGRSHDLQLLVAARERLLNQATASRNALHAYLRLVLPGYARLAPNLVAARHRTAIGRALRAQRGVTAELARGELRRLERLLGEADALEARIRPLVADDPLQRLRGAGPLTAAMLRGHAGDARRLRSHHAFASLAGAAPVPASSGQTQRMRLNRGGNRQLNRALYVIALTQLRSHPPAQAYLARKRAEGKSGAEAIRCLKRQLARQVFRLLQEGAAVDDVTRLTT
ncbi:MAG: IS110 family transposase [Candidatus Limnocylindria bacterium]